MGGEGKGIEKEESEEIESEWRRRERVIGEGEKGVRE